MKHSIKNSVISGTGLLLAISLFIATIILANTAFTTWRIDLTENKLFTLSKGTKNILNNLDEPVQLDFYFSQKAMNDFPLLANYGVRVRDMLEEFTAHANGKLILNIIEPETFSEAEDQAVASGLRTVSVNATSDRVYFGLVGANSTDDEKVIPFFQSNRESALEYDLTKLVYNLAYPDKRVVGIYSQLPMISSRGDKTTETWTIINALKEFFEVVNLNENIEALNEKIDVLMLVHPKKIKRENLYIIDQYLLKGGKAIIFLDPLAEQDRTQPDATTPDVMPILYSYLDELLEKWGIEIAKEKIVADINAAMRVQASSPRGPQEIDYLPWLRLTEKNFNVDDFSTSELNLIHMGTVGSIEIIEEEKLEITPLIESSKQSTKLERDLILFQRDPTVILSNFKSDDKKLLIAARLKGRAESVFLEDQKNNDEIIKDDSFVDEGDLNVILVSDTDILADHFWIRKQDMLGVSVPQPVSNNGDFVINSIENLSGNTDLISLRGRGKYSRPFLKVETIRKQAESKFREREKELQVALQETEKKIQQLQQEQGNEKSYLLNKYTNC